MRDTKRKHLLKTIYWLQNLVCKAHLDYLLCLQPATPVLSIRLLQTLFSLPARHSLLPRAQFFEKWHLWQLLFLRSYIIAKTKQSLERVAFSFEDLVLSSPLRLSCLLPLHALPHTHVSPAPSQVPTGPCSFCPQLFGPCPAVRVRCVSLS